MPLKILLADDSVAAQNMGRKILVAAGHDVVTVSNGVEALKKINDLHPDIALLDAYLAGYTGIELCLKTKLSAEMARMPILLTAGKMEPFCAEEAIKIKADGLITKPFDVTNLITAVEKVAEHLRPTEPAAPPCLVVHGFTVSKEVAAEAQAWPLQRSESCVTEAALQSQPTLEPIEGYRSVPAARAKTATPCFSPRQGGEVCDVCGHVQREVAFACEQCDVPLPSSVWSPVDSERRFSDL